VIRKVAIAIAAACVAWVVGVTLFYRSGGINPAGVVPSLGCLTALWGSVRSDSRLMWFGTGVVLVSAVAFVFSVGPAVAPTALALVVGSFVLSRGSEVSP
jgi:hypothetical protein